jgi:nucleotide-binding universal stress UspA family protein
MFRHILLPTDGTEISGRAVRACVEFAKAAGARVTGFHAMPDYHMVHFAGVAPDPATRQAFASAAERNTEACLAAVTAEARVLGVDCTAASAVSNTPYRAILDAARDRDCDLIFMAPHSRADMEAGLLGSQTLRVLTFGRVPILVYR